MSMFFLHHFHHVALFTTLILTKLTVLQEIFAQVKSQGNQIKITM